MPRRPRVFVEGGLYHVYNCFASGETVFADPEEAQAFVKLFRWVKKRDGWTVVAWCLMTNHYPFVAGRYPSLTGCNTSRGDSVSVSTGAEGGPARCGKADIKRS
jgi:hypothetical protein